MTELTITTDEGFGDDGIFPRRVISVDGTKVPTPAGTIPVDRLEEDQNVNPQARGINEIHISVNEDTIRREMDSEEGPITREITSALEHTDDDELTVIFTTYNEYEIIEVDDDEKVKVPDRLDGDQAKCLVHTISPHTDLLPIPMFRHITHVMDGDLGRNDPNYLDYLRSIVTFLNNAEAHGQTKPIMGVLPIRFPWECLEGLFEIYTSFDIKAFHLNLDRLKFTADRQVGKIEELWEHLVDLEKENETLLYLINGERGDFDAEIEAFPASDIASLGYGVDVVGGRRVSPRMDWDKVEPDPEAFYLFDRELNVYRKLRLNYLNRHFPKESAFEVGDVVQQIRIDPEVRFDLQALVNAEQVSLSIMDYRKYEPEEEAPMNFRGKTGITDGIGDSMLDLRNTYEDAIDERSQSGLEDF